MEIKYSLLVDIGLKKESNQDRVYASQLDERTWIFGVADGLGGQPGGEEAADIVLSTMENFTPRKDDLAQQTVQLLLEAGEAIIREGDKNPDLYCMCSTADVIIIREYTAFWAHVGDCRIYHYHKNKFVQITSDQNLAGQLFRDGEISAEERETHPGRTFLLQALGEDDIEPESGSFTLATGDLLLLCSDGLHDLVNDQTIKKTLNETASPAQKVEALKTHALQAGGDDNIALILIQVQ
jgi:protein phosphatase